MTIQTVILAAGRSTRMRSERPKALHTLAGKYLLQYVIEQALALSAAPVPIVIIGHQGQLIQRTLKTFPVQWVEQAQPLGTAHALQQALPLLDSTSDRVLVLCGDVPLITQETLTRFISLISKAAIGMMTAHLSDPSQYGRVKRNAQQQVIQIIEEKEATTEERALTEVNTGIYLIPTVFLKQLLHTICNHNAQQEYYLTDLIRLAQTKGQFVETFSVTSVEEILGVNDRSQLAFLERHYQRKQATQLMQKGVTLLDPERLDVRGVVNIAQDVTIDVNVILEGKVTIGKNCVIGPHVVLRDVFLEEGVQVRAHSVLEGVTLGKGCVIGPFARLRPGTVLGEAVHVGNFVEIKKSNIQHHSKVNHLSYIGDCEMGKNVNIGAGTITCNYDGANKHKTIIGDEVHIGSGTQLVAPLIIESGATIGAGSTVIKPVPANQLTLTQTLSQRTVDHWRRPVKLTQKDETG